MPKLIEIENIEAMRWQAGIDDIELRKQIHGLAAGDFIKLTLLTGMHPLGGETLLVRITSIKGVTFRGKLTQQPFAHSLAKLHAGSAVVFTAAHIHSVLKR